MKQDGAAPAIFVVGEPAGGADEAGHVDVVTAGVHDADGVSLVVLGLDLAGEGQAGSLDDGQGVHVGPDEDGGAFAVLEDADDAELANASR